MSHPIFLESPPWPRMPEGRKGELPTYYKSGGPSLEANGTIPLLWLALFSLGDIRYAASIDVFDPKADTVELEDFHERATPSDLEATYPYLVANRDSALARLDARQERLIRLLGERYRPIYQAFANYIREHYRNYVLLRTSGLPDVESATGWITSALTEMEDMECSDAPVPAPLADAGRSLRCAQDADAVWRVSGSWMDHDDESLSWPSQQLIAAFPACAPRKRTPPGAGAPVRARPSYQPDTVLDKVLEWCAVFIFAAVAVVVWWKTRSIWFALLAAVPVGGIMGWLLARLNRMKQPD